MEITIVSGLMTPIIFYQCILPLRISLLPPGGATHRQLISSPNIQGVGYTLNHERTKNFTSLAVMDGFHLLPIDQHGVDQNADPSQDEQRGTEERPIDVE